MGRKGFESFTCGLLGDRSYINFTASLPPNILLSSHNKPNMAAPAVLVIPAWHFALVFTETCPKCGHLRAYFMQIQTRSADEPMTTFYKCCNAQCGHRWRDWHICTLKIINIFNTQMTPLDLIFEPLFNSHELLQLWNMIWCFCRFYSPFRHNRRKFKFTLCLWKYVLTVYEKQGSCSWSIHELIAAHSVIIGLYYIQYLLSILQITLKLVSMKNHVLIFIDKIVNVYNSQTNLTYIVIHITDI